MITIFTPLPLPERLPHPGPGSLPLPTGKNRDHLGSPDLKRSNPVQYITTLSPSTRNRPTFSSERDERSRTTAKFPTTHLRRGRTPPGQAFAASGLHKLINFFSLLLCRIFSRFW
ncbi:MAG: hypothetical protein LUQ50_08380 [Methanospirillum sp.]|uniref:hypothetical protein n=1 Tax=Methanospirillum sp. TaxID=45200 RepID=UPI00236D1D8C|nr:hypothetical protein [Methanospirillum sp.]MDD1729072.1 hypothetical protein [Methanospirillum sp.]